MILSSRLIYIELRRRIICNERLESVGEFTPQHYLIRRNLLDEESIPSNNGKSLHGISQPRQNFDHGHNAQKRPPSLTARNMKGNSYPKLSSL